MPRRPDSATVRRQLDRLRALALDPPRRSDYALELIACDTSTEVLLPAVQALAESPSSLAREPLRALYARFDTPKADPGCHLREAIVRALRPIAVPADVGLLERAIATVESSPHDSAGGSTLRAAALVTLVDLDPELAGFHAATLLVLAGDRFRTSDMTGEPAATAARVLGAVGQQVALIVALAGMPDLHGDVYAACLRELRDVPDRVLAPILESAAFDRRESVRLGLCDLLVAHQLTPPVLHAAADFLRNVRDVDLYRYLVASIVAERSEVLLHVVATHAREEYRLPKLEVLREQLAVRKGDSAVELARAAVEERLAGGGPPPPAGEDILARLRGEDAD